MSCRALALIVAALLIVGCQKEIVREPYPVYVEVPVLAELPEELLTPCPVTNAANRQVGEYVRVAITNTPALIVCAKQIEGIRKVYGIETP